MDAATSRLGHLIARLSLFCAHFPKTVVLFYLVLAGASVYLATTRLQFRVHRDDMIRDDHPVQIAWKNYLSLNGPDDDLVAVVEGSNPARMEKAIDRLAEEFRARPNQFDRVLEKVDPSTFRNKALQLLTIDKIQQIELALKEMKPLFDLPFGWNLFTLQSLLIEAKTKLRNITIGRKISPGDERFLEGFKRILDCANNYFADKGTYVSPWNSLRPEGFDSQLTLDHPTYFFNKDKTLAFLSVRPKPSPDNVMAPYLAGVLDAKHLLDQIRHEFPDIQIGLTGLPALECDEMEASKADTNRASWLALGLVFGLYLVVFRGLRIPLLTVVPLITGTVLALGLTAITVGHLNLLSSTFALMLIGVGDYGILWISRFDEEKSKGHSSTQATLLTAASMGTAIAFASLTMAVAFGATSFADFQAVAELGFIAGCGTLLCGLTSFTLLPSLLTWFGPPEKASKTTGNLNFAQAKSEQSPNQVPVLPKSLLPLLAFGILGMIPLIFFLRYDSNLLHLQSESLESVIWQNRLLQKCPQASWHAVVVAKDRQEALDLTEKLKKVSEVSSVAETASLVPTDPSSTLAAIQNIKGYLQKLPQLGQSLPIAANSPKTLLKEIKAFEDWLQTEKSNPRKTREFDEIEERLNKLNGFLSKGTPSAAVTLTNFDRRLVTDLIENLHQLKSMCSLEPLRPDEWPTSLRERFEAGNHFFLRIFPAFDTWDYQGLRQFTEAVSKVTPQATGKPYTTRLGLEQMRDSFVQAAWYAFFAILVIVLLELRSLGHVILALIPMISGLVVSLGTLVLLGVDLNPANMIGLPLLVGIGIDNGLHLVHDFRSKQGSYKLDFSVFRGIAIASATTALGFGCLLISSHKGLASLGLLLSTGVVACSTCALLILPVIFGIIRGNKPLSKQKSIPEVPPLAKAA